jgi:hypothetical protein
MSLKTPCSMLVMQVNNSGCCCNKEIHADTVSTGTTANGSQPAWKARAAVAPPHSSAQQQWLCSRPLLSLEMLARFLWPGGPKRPWVCTRTEKASWLVDLLPSCSDFILLALTGALMIRDLRVESRLLAPEEASTPWSLQVGAVFIKKPDPASSISTSRTILISLPTMVLLELMAIARAFNLSAA